MYICMYSNESQVDMLRKENMGKRVITTICKKKKEIRKIDGFLSQTNDMVIISKKI